MTLWKTMLSVGWCLHTLFIMPFPAISASNLLSRLNNLTFTFGIWRGRRSSRGCCYLWGPHNSGPGRVGALVTTAALPIWSPTLSASADVSLALHLPPNHLPHLPPPSCQVTCRERLLFIFNLQVYRRNKASRFKASRFKKTEQKFDYKYI